MYIHQNNNIWVCLKQPNKEKKLYTDSDGKNIYKMNKQNKEKNKTT